MIEGWRSGGGFTVRWGEGKLSVKMVLGFAKRRFHRFVARFETWRVTRWQSTSVDDFDRISRMFGMFLIPFSLVVGVGYLSLDYTEDRIRRAINAKVARSHRDSQRRQPTSSNLKTEPMPAGVPPSTPMPPTGAP